MNSHDNWANQARILVSYAQVTPGSLCQLAWGEWNWILKSNTLHTHGLHVDMKKHARESLQETWGGYPGGATQ